MLKVKVIADNILNLTDARYFAALGVNYLVFDLEKIHTTSIKEIKEWVEGVKILLDTKGELTPGFVEQLLDIEPDGIISLDKNFLISIKEQFPEIESFLRDDDGKLSQIKNETTSKPFVKIDGNEISVESIIESKDISGIIVEGKPEEKIGFKNFDELDEIFDLLSD